MRPRTVLTGLLATGFAVLSVPGILRAEQTDAISREISCFTVPVAETPVHEISDAVTRELSVFTVPVAETPSHPISDAVTRELSVFTVPVAETPSHPVSDAISREVHAYVGQAPTYFSKAWLLGSPIAIAPSVVTAVFPGFFYVESADRTAGIRIHWDGSVAEGSMVEVRGTTGITGDGERCVLAAVVTSTGTGTIEPIAMAVRSLGGSDYRCSPDRKRGQLGTDALDWTAGRAVKVPGLNNIGLLVKTWGRVTWAGDDAFVVDDGSGHIYGDQSAPGVRVALPAGAVPPEVGAWVTVTGISSCYAQGDLVYRLLRVRQAGDVVMPEE